MLNLDVFSDGSDDIKHRLAERRQRVISANIDAIAGKSVLDIAANNGRWTYAALAAGASHVTSIEGRQGRVDDAVKFIDKLGFSNKYTANVGDMYDFLYENRNGYFDTVLLLGVYYHVMDHYYLLKSIARTKPATIIIDSAFVRSFRSSIHIQYETPGLHRNALAVYEGQKAEPVGFVSLGLMIQMAWNLGYDCRPVLWAPDEVVEKTAVQDYMMGRRFTLRLNKMEGHHDSGWQEPWAKALVAVNPRFGKLMDPRTHDEAVDTRASKTAEFTVF